MFISSFCQKLRWYNNYIQHSRNMLKLALNNNQSINYIYCYTVHFYICTSLSSKKITKNLSVPFHFLVSKLFTWTNAYAYSGSLNNFRMWLILNNYYFLLIIILKKKVFLNNSTNNNKTNNPPLTSTIPLISTKWTIHLSPQLIKQRLRHMIGNFNVNDFLVKKIWNSI
jgi:hypothetical protein